MRAAMGVVFVVLVVVAGWWWSARGDDHALPEPVAQSVAEPAAGAPGGFELDGTAVEPAEPLALPAEGAPDDSQVEVVVQTRWIGEGDPPGAGIAVELGVTLNRHRTGDVLTTIETDEAGLARGVLPRAALTDQPGAGPVGVFAQVDSDDVKRVHKIAQVSRDEVGPVEIVLTLKRQAIVEGRLVDGHDQPIGGRVRALELMGEGDLRWSGGLATADSEGRFRIAVQGVGRFVLRAEGSGSDLGGDFEAQATVDSMRHGHTDLGTGVSEPFDVVWREPVADQLVRVTGPGRLHGRVLDDAGQPAAGLLLQIAMHEGPDWFSDQTTGGGHSSARGKTGSDGRFDLSGLRDGRFTILAAGSDGRFDDGAHELTPEPVPSTGPELVLRLTRPHLVVRVLHADGRTATEVERPQRNLFRGDESPWPSAPTLRVTVARDHEPENWARALALQPLEPGEFSADAEAGKAYDVAVYGGTVPWTTQRVELPLGAGRRDVEVVLPEPVGLGTLVLDVIDAEGRALTEDLSVRLVDRATGAALLSYAFPYADAADWPQRIAVPEGLHWLVVEDAAYVESQHGTVRKRRSGGRFETDLSIQADRDTQVKARLGAGARLRLRVDGSVREEDRRVVRQGLRDFDPENEGHREYVDYWAPHVRVQLERENEWPEWVQFMRRGYEGTSAAGNHLWSSVAFGSEELSEVVSPGRVTLVVRARGGREARRELELLEGQTHDVVIDLE